MESLPLEPYDIADIPSFLDPLYVVAIIAIILAVAAFIYRFRGLRKSPQTIVTLDRFTQIKSEIDSIIGNGLPEKGEIALLLSKLRRIDAPLDIETVSSVERYVFSNSSSVDELKVALATLKKDLGGS